MMDPREAFQVRLSFYDQLDFRHHTAVEASTKLYQTRAVEIIKTNLLASQPPRPTSETRHSFLEFPGEIRNKIYDYVVNMRSSRTLVPRRGFTTKYCAFLGLLLTCRQISFELRTRIEAQVIAYIPIMGAMQYGALAHAISNFGTSGLLPIQTTILTALTSFMNVRFHFHNGALQEKIILDHTSRLVRYLQDGRRNFDECGSFVLFRFRQALLIFTSCSELVVRHYGGVTQRQATVHFDHLTIDWRFRLSFYRFNNMRFLLSRMAQDKHTDWKIRHYFFTGYERGNLDVMLPVLDSMLRREYRGHQASCAALDNVRIIMDVYGNGKWSYEGREDKKGITRDCVESSTLWPSWPERDVPWRGGIMEEGRWTRWDFRILE